ncbi:b(0,+)-type amino acid transporter 1 [Bagarius yarrelli]|uniref:b(0,+)-type amino acid transporter 1 n=1 Tax=Bagarius yarrelli TaxID=175774 RepID=A0A556U541_BAGYA|nr:b(0,+)-type amino acid transporter 1 [Bagarius yarrelli]
MAFIYAFSSVLVVRPASMTGLALSFGINAVAPFYEDCEPPTLVVKSVAAFSLVILTIVNCLNVSYSMAFTTILMALKLFALAVISIGGVVLLLQGNIENHQNAFEGTSFTIGVIGMSFYQCLWAYDGWSTLNSVTEELKHPEHAQGIHFIKDRDMDITSKKLQLKSEVGLIGGVSLIAGVMIGSGIFMSPQTVLLYIGSPGASLVIWACCGLLAMLASLSFAELGTVIRESGGEYIYIIRTSGNLMAFIYAFSSVLVVRPASMTGLALSFGINAVAPFYEDCEPPTLVVKLVAAFSLVILTIVNCLNVRYSMALTTILMALKFLALAIISIGGIVLLLQGNTGNLQNAFEGTSSNIGVIGMSFYQCLWAYDGWSTLNSVTEELKRPEVNLPRALMIAIPMVTVLYLLVNISYLAAMTPREMMVSSAVAVTWGNKVLGNWGWVMSIAGALSSFGSLNGSFFSGGRVCFVAAREGHMPNILAMAHVRRLTPSPALIFTTIISLIVLIPGDFQGIVNFFSFTAWFFYGVTIIGLLYLKIKFPHLPRTYKAPIIIPILVLLAAVFLVLAPIIDNPQIEYLYVTLFILSGALIYIPFIHFKLCPHMLDKLTVLLQLFLEVAPAEKNL